MLGFLKRNSSEFTEPSTLVTLYNSLVRPQLEYCSIVWNPVFNFHSLRIEKVQKNFTRYVYLKLVWQLERPCYSDEFLLRKPSIANDLDTMRSI